MRPHHSTWTTSTTTTASTTFPCATPANAPLSYNPLRYAMYLHLKSKHPGTFLVPCYDFDLVWHAHQLDPVTYAADTKAVLGKLMPHDDSVNDRSEGERTPPSVALGTPAHHSCTRTATPSTPTTLTAPTVPRPGSKLSNAAATTRRLWSAAFPGQAFDQPGCMFRGPPPPPPPSAEARAALDARICGEGLMLTLSSATLVGEVSRKGKPERDLKVRTPNPFLLAYLCTHDYLHGAHTHRSLATSPQISLRTPFDLPPTFSPPSRRSTSSYVARTSSHVATRSQAPSSGGTRASRALSRRRERKATQRQLWSATSRSSSTPGKHKSRCRVPPALSCCPASRASNPSARSSGSSGRRT